MRLGLQGLLGFSIVLAAATVLCGEQITSTCRITAVDAAKRTVTLVRKTASGEKSGVAKVADNANIDIGGKPAALASLQVPVEATVVYDTQSRVLVSIKVADKPIPIGAEPPRAVAPFDASRAKEHQEAWAKHLGVPVEMTNSAGMKLVLIPPGEFDMGSSRTDIDGLLREAKEKSTPSWHTEKIPAEGPRHRVRITRPFYLGQHEVTVGQFQRFVTEARYRTSQERATEDSATTGGKAAAKPPKGDWRSPGFTQTNDHPVVLVDWSDAIAFYEWLSRKETATYSLPTEAQREFACRAGTTTAFYFGDSPTEIGEHAWYAANADKSPHPVGRKLPNPWRLHDMSGNVSEWCADWFHPDYYKPTAVVDPVGPDSGTSRVVRGGAFYDTDPARLRSACRGDHQGPRPGCGFRVVREIQPTTKSPTN